ncbi:MAG: conserved membrane protein of unknown function [Promethearchaeota archaeon]|nr:MAG: conserved membrane protein of unknown function [Candidatus Lokiarchaeota archaeon]
MQGEIGVSNRKAPSFFSYFDLLTNRVVIYLGLIIVPLLISIVSTVFNQLYFGSFNFMVALDYFFQIFIIFFLSETITIVISLVYSKKAPILKLPPQGWSFQLNEIFNLIIGIIYISGHFLSWILGNITFQEIFFILGIIVAYIVAFVIYFSFTTVGQPGFFILSLSQPVIGIVLYSIFTAQFSVDFFIKAIVFCCSCALIFTIPYAKGLFQVSNIYKEATGLGGYKFIRSFVLSMLTEGNDYQIEELFDEVGHKANIKVQYLFIKSQKSDKIKGLFVIPDVHFGPFKTCGSSDLPELIYKTLERIPGATVYHTTNDHSKNLTKQLEVEKITKQITQDVKKVENISQSVWVRYIGGFSRDLDNTAKILGLRINQVPIVILTRHPLPSDDIQSEIGAKIQKETRDMGYDDIIVIDAHNSIIGDEVLIKDGSNEAKDLINATKNLLLKFKEYPNDNDDTEMLYGVARDRMLEYREEDGIGYGGIILHLFQNQKTKQKTALIHFDANNAYSDIRSYILNMLQNIGIEKGEITTSDSHTVARKFTSRGYSPLGDKIKVNEILKKVQNLIRKAEENLEPVEFLYKRSIIEDIKIWGEPKYFDVVMNTLKEAIKVTQRLLGLSLIAPTFFSLILLLFYYNINITDII